jgi:hypothetical protein
MRQAELLREVSRDIDPATIKEVQVAIAEDIRFFEMIQSRETRDQLIQQFLVGEIEIRAGTVEAAQVLVNLVLGD